MLAVSDLVVSVGGPSGPIEVVRRASFRIAPGEVMGLVGESGSGKSMTSLAVMGLLPHPQAWVASGRIDLDGAEITTLTPHERVRRHCGGIAMVFQEPMSSLNPVTRIGRQIEEAVRVHDPRVDPGRIAHASFSTWCESPTRASSSAPTRTSSRGACASG